MTNEAILAAIDQEIEKLQRARAMLADATATPAKKVGRPKGAPKKVSKKRSMSAEGRARIAAAQKKRWGSAKKAAK